MLRLVLNRSSMSFSLASPAPLNRWALRRNTSASARFFAHLLRPLKRLFDRLHSRSGAASLAVSLGLQRLKHWKPQARSGSPPTCNSRRKLFDPPIKFAMADGSPATTDSAKVDPVRKALFSAKRKEQVGASLETVRATAENAHQAASMGEGVNERMRMSQFLGAPQRFARDSFGLIRRTKMPKGPAKVAKCSRADVLTILMGHGHMPLRIVERAGPPEMRQRSSKVAAIQKSRPHRPVCHT